MYSIVIFVYNFCLFSEFIQASSSYCNEPEKAFISDVLFVKDKACACALKPLLELCLSTWRAPPPSPARIAFVPNVKPKFHNDSPDDIKPSTSLDPDTKKEYLNILLECDLEGEDPEELSILPVGIQFNFPVNFFVFS